MTNQNDDNLEGGNDRLVQEIRTERTNLEPAIKLVLAIHR